MQNQKLRQIVFFDLNLTTSPPGPPPPMLEVAGYLKERIDAGNCIRLIEAERYLIGIVEARIISTPNGGKALALLFIFVDPDAADTANMHLQTRQVRRFAKEAGEGRAFSSHVLIDLTPRTFGSGIFRVLLENAERLGKTRVRAELQREFKQVFSDKEITVENADGDDVRATPTIQLSAIASDRFKAGIKEGTLKEVKLIDTSAVDREFDAPEAVKVRRREMSLKVDVPIGKTVESILKEITPWAKSNDFNEMYVRWVPSIDEETAASRPPREAERAKINLAQDDIGETLYARKEFVSLDNPLSDLSEHFSDELLTAMVALMG